MVPASKLGTTLPHEHILVDFIGADRVIPSRYRAEDVIAAALPHLDRIKSLGVTTFIDCTPAYLGRDPVLLRSLSERSGLNIVTNTGYYGAAGEKYLPALVRDESADQLAERWIAEWRQGIGSSGVRPGFIKIGVDRGPLTGNQRKIVRAAARAHRGSGLTIAAHTGDGAAAMEQIAILRAERLSPSSWIWVHAQNEPDLSLQVKAAREGAWVELDGVAPDSVDENVKTLLQFRKERILGRILLSHDAGWYHVGEPGGGDFRPFDLLLTRLLPALREKGFTPEEIEQLTVDNPRDAFSLGVRSV